MAFVRNPPIVTSKVAGNVRNIGSVSSPKLISFPNSRPTLKHPLMKPASNAIRRPLGKLKSLTASFFSSSERVADFIAPATPMIAIPMRVTTTPMMTDEVRADNALSSGKNTLRRTGPMIVPRPAHVPKAIDCPRATPRYRIERPKVSPPTPQSTPKNIVSNVALGEAA